MEKEREEEEEEEEEEEKKEEEEEEKKEEEEEKKEEENYEDAETLICKLLIEAKKNKNADVEALARVTRRSLERKSWYQPLTEESFVDQHLLSFVECILLSDKSLISWR